MDDSWVFQAFCQHAKAFLALANPQNARRPALTSISTQKRDRLNEILNELAGLNYRHEQLLADYSLTHHLFNAFSALPVSEDTLLVKACALIIEIINASAAVQPNQKHRQLQQRLPVGLLGRLLDWLLRAISHNGRVALSDVLHTVRLLLVANSAGAVIELSTQQLHAVLQMIHGVLIDVDGTTGRRANDDAFDSCAPAEIELSAAVCLESACTHLRLANLADSTTAGNEQGMQLLGALLNITVQRLFSDDVQHADEQYRCACTAARLNACRLLIVAIDSGKTRDNSGASDIVELRIGELLGAARSFMRYGLPGVKRIWPPVRLQVSQQAISEPAMTDTAVNRGGKMAKLRKVVVSTTSGVTEPRRRRKEKAKPTTTGKGGGDFDSELLRMRIDLKAVSLITSESDFSESEANDQLHKLEQKKSLVRLAALLLIDTVAQNTRTRTMFGYWHAFFPDMAPMPPQSLALLNCALLDPNRRCRAAALHATISCLDGSRGYLTQAENRNCDARPAAYTPFAVALADQVVAMHVVLGQVVSSETAKSVLVQALKCLIVLVQQTSYARLQSGFVDESVVQPVRQLLHDNDASVQATALVVFQELIARGEKSSEIFDIIGLVCQPGSLTNKQRAIAEQQNIDEDIPLDERAESDSDEECPVPSPQRPESPPTANPNSVSEPTPWLLQIVLDNLNNNSVSSPIRIESLHIISTMARNFGMIRAHLDVILSAVIGTLEDDSASQDVHIFAAKSLDVIGHFMNIYLLDDKPTADDMRSCQHFWQVATQQLLGKIAQPTEHSTCLLAICCDALSNISAPLFERLPVFEQRYLICTLTDAALSAERAIRAAAVRALGVYVLFPTLRDDRHFVASTVEAIVAAQPSIHLDVRIKTSWALANVAQALLLLVEEADAEQAMAMPVDDEHLKQLFETALLCRLNDMVRSNALRALGSLLRLLRPTHMQHTFWLDMSRTAIGRLHDSTGGVGNTKVKWNACYALGNFMNNAVFFETPELVAGSGKAPSWRALVLPTLCKLIVDFPNFKVRINAAAALAVPARREWLAEHFGAVWSSLLEGLEQSDRIDDFNEYQHRDNLVDQLCITLAHYICLAHADDLPALAAQLRRHDDAVAAKWQRVCNRILPARAGALAAAASKLRMHEETAVQRSDEWSAAQVLCKCFVSVVR